jgi:hypothetical protein
VQKGSYAHVGETQVGEDISLKAGNDLAIEGLEVEAARYILAEAAGGRKHLVSGGPPTKSIAGSVRCMPMHRFCIASA